MNENAAEIIALSEENMRLKVALVKLTQYYRLKKMERRVILMKCYLRLREAKAEIERQNQIISRLEQEKNVTNAQDELPDSTT